MRTEAIMPSHLWIILCFVTSALAWEDDPSCGESQYPDAGRDQDPLRLRVSGGWEAREHEFPYMVNIQRASIGSQYCGGTLVSERHVITAAHCVSGSSVNNVFCVLGAHTREGEEGNRVELSAIKIHEGFNPITFDNDVAVLTLASGQEFDDTQRPACKPSDHYYEESCVISGWGATEPEGPPSPTLRYTVTDILDLEVCRTNSMPIVLPFSALCTGDLDTGLPNGRDPCQGDSGGPLAVKVDNKFHLAGLVTWSVTCGANEERPSVHVSVYSYIDWFDAQIPSN